MRGLPVLRPLLAFVVGFVDTAAFVHFGGLFVAHVTGNIVLLGATLAGSAVHHGENALLQLITFPVFFAAASVAAALASRFKGQAADFTVPLLWAAASLIALATLVAWWPTRAAASALLLVMAMATLNAAHRLDTRLGPPFTVMTGNITALAIAAAQALGLARSLPRSAGAGNVALLALFFASGAVAGALGDARFGLLAMGFPAVLLIGHLSFGLRMEPAA